MSTRSASEILVLFVVLLLHLTSIDASTHVNEIHRRTSIADGVDLRVLPLGDSITFGEGSTDGNGYRLALSNLLINAGNRLEYIGSVQSGTMANNENEGHGGFQIVPVGLTGKSDFPKRPNVVLFMAGTNDIIFNVDVESAPQRLGAVIEGVITECPDAAVLVGSLTPLVNPGWMSKIETFNSVLPGAISGLAASGKSVALVNMSRVTLSHIHTNDGIHPTDEAYELIAAAWYEGIVEAGKHNWIKKPVSATSPSQSPETGIQDMMSLNSHDGIETAMQRLNIDTVMTTAQFMVYGIILFLLMYAARKIAGTFLRRQRT